MKKQKKNPFFSKLFFFFLLSQRAGTVHVFLGQDSKNRLSHQLTWITCDKCDTLPKHYDVSMSAGRKRCSVMEAWGVYYRQSLHTLLNQGQRFSRFFFLFFFLIIAGHLVKIESFHSFFFIGVFHLSTDERSTYCQYENTYPHNETYTHFKVYA